VKKSTVLAQNSIDEVIFSSYEWFHIPFAKTTLAASHYP
jgi:hypothetical protein